MGKNIVSWFIYMIKFLTRQKKFSIFLKQIPRHSTNKEDIKNSKFAVTNNTHVLSSCTDVLYKTLYSLCLLCFNQYIEFDLK